MIVKSHAEAWPLFSADTTIPCDCDQHSWVWWEWESKGGPAPLDYRADLFECASCGAVFTYDDAWPREPDDYDDLEVVDDEGATGERTVAP